MALKLLGLVPLVILGYATVLAMADVASWENPVCVQSTTIYEYDTEYLACLRWEKRHAS